MKINFASLKQEKVEHMRGGEKYATRNIYNDGTNRIMLLKLEKGASVGYHIHDDSCEVIYVLEGQATVKNDDETYTVASGEAEYCPKGHSHSIINLGDETLVAMAVVAAQ